MYWSMDHVQSCFPLFIDKVWVSPCLFQFIIHPLVTLISS